MHDKLVNYILIGNSQNVYDFDKRQVAPKGPRRNILRLINKFELLTIIDNFGKHTIIDK